MNKKQRDSLFLYKELEDRIIKYNPYFNKIKLKEAFDYLNWKCLDKENVNSFLNTAIILTKLEVDDLTLISTLLFWIPKNKRGFIKKSFWKEVYHLVNSLEKFKSVEYTLWLHQWQINKLKYKLISSWDDLRIYLISIAVRFNLLQKLRIYSKEKRFLVAKETLDLYLPIINFLWIWEFLWDIQDLCFKYTYEEEFKKLDKFFWKNYKKNLKKILLIHKRVWNELKEHNVDVLKIEWRVKKLHSIYKKLQKKNIAITDIYDILALRIITENTDDAYKALWIVHGLYNVKTERFKDYISTPKNNWYQAIHTTVVDENWEYIEFQILTNQMAILNKSWIAAHFLYKWFWVDYSNIPEWMKKYIDIQKQTINTKEVIKKIKSDLLQLDIHVYNTDGKNLMLPKNATLIDFAYCLDKKYWDYFNWAYVNGNYIKNPFHILNNWDYIKLEKWKNINFNYKIENYLLVKTSKARTWLKDIFYKYSKEKLIQAWEYILNHELEKYDLPNFNDLKLEKQKIIIKKFWVLNKQQFFLFVWMESIDLNKIMDAIINLVKRNNYITKISLRILQKTKTSSSINLIIKLIHELWWEINFINYNENKKFIKINLMWEKNKIDYIITEINRIPNIYKTIVVLPKKIVFLYSIFLLNWITITLLILLMNYLKMKYSQPYSFELILLLWSIFMFSSLWFIRLLAKKYNPDLLYFKRYWGFVFIINTIIYLTILFNFIWLDKKIISNLVFVFLSFYYIKTFFDYRDFKHKKKSI